MTRTRSTARTQKQDSEDRTRFRIAALEGNPAHARSIRDMAARADHECRTFSDGRRMLLTLRRVSFDLLLLEWRVAGMGGMEILEWARAHLDPRIPVMFLAAHDDEADIAAALGAGADDYMLKPIRPVELAARVGALLRRAYPDIGACGDSLITCGAFTFDVLARQATRHGAVITLTPKEFELALLLFRNEGRVVPREHMVLAIWGRDIPPMSRTIDTHISRVRNKLGLWDENGVRVQPVYTYGYRLERVDEHGQPVTRGRRGRVRAKKKAPEGAFPKIS